MSKTKMRAEDEHARLRMRVREIFNSIQSHFQHFYLSIFVVFSFSTFFLSAFFHPLVSKISSTSSEAYVLVTDKTTNLRLPFSEK